MAQRFKNRGNRGFSLVETLAVVAILVILLSISAVAAAYYRDYLKITELDNAAREIYMAAENRAVLLNSGDQMDKALANGTAITLSESGGASGSVERTYVTYKGPDDGAALGNLLTSGAIDPTLLDGQFHIVYDQASGAVTDVFYTEGPEDIQDINDALTIAGDRDARMRPKKGPMLGYYGGEQTARKDYTPLPAPEVMVVVENGDLLRVHVTFSVPDAALSVVGNSWILDAKQEVWLDYGGNRRCLLNMNTGKVVKISRPPSGRDIVADYSYITYTWILDALDRVNDKGETVEDRHFRQLFDDPNLTFGGDFTVTAEIELSAPGRRSTSASGSDTGNSLFAEHSGGSTAQLENLRHLQNLDADTSKVGGKTAAVQLNDIDCHGTDNRDDPAYGCRYAFRSIGNDELSSFDAGWTAEGEGNRRNEITGLRVTADSAKKADSTKDELGAGLFAWTKEGMRITGVRLIGAEVDARPSDGNEAADPDAPVAAGVLVGAAGAGSSFQDIRVVNSKAVSPNGPAGGIAGKIAGGENPNRFTDCQVYWEPETGQANLRSLLGSDQTENSYKYGEIIHGTSAGGLAGELSGDSGTTEINKSLAATLVDGTIAGGLIGDAQHKAKVNTSYADCYIKGTTCAAGLIGQGKTGGTTSAGVELTNVYTAGFIDYGSEGTSVQAAGLVNINGTMKGENVYDAMSFLNRPETAEPTRGVPDNQSAELRQHCYYLDPAVPSLGPGAELKDGSVSYDDMSTAGLFDKAMGSAFAFKTVSADTNPYNLQEKQTLSPPYSFPGLTGLPHYGDWRAYFKEPSLVYYEKDSSGSIGFSGGNARELIGQLEENVTIQKDGYAVARQKTDLAHKDGSGNWAIDVTSFEISYKSIVTTVQSAERDGTTVQEVQEVSREEIGPITCKTAELLEASWTRKEAGEDVVYEYFLIPLPDNLVIGTATGKDFYQYFRFEITETGGAGAETKISGEYFYNPHFAETVRPYVPEVEGKPLIDWEKKWTGVGTQPYTPETAAEGTHQYITGTLTPGNRPVSVSVRTPRHLFHLSQYEDYYNNVRLAFQQGLRLDGGEGVYTGYDDLLKHEDGTRKFQIQSPIGTQAKSFLGTYNGNCLPIRRVAFEIPLNDKNRVCAGLFGSSGGTLQNIVYSLSPSEEDGAGQEDTQRSIKFYSNEKETFLGALAGFNTLTGKIINCAVEGVNLTTQVNTADVYIGGLCGENAGLIQGSAAESAYLHVEASSYAQAYAGGLVGYNRNEIETSYAVGRLAAEAAQENAPVTLAGFAGLNSGSISNSYSAMDLKPDGTAAAAYGFCGPSSGGRQRETYYLNDGNFSYRNEAFLAKYEEGGSAQPLTYVQLTAETSPVPGMGKVAVPAGQKEEDFFPYPTGVKKGAVSWHYGDWPRALELGTMGVYYWEELQLPGKPISYHVSLLAVDPGETAEAAKTISKFSTLSTAHDQGGEVVRCGYGIYNKQGITVTLKDDTPFPLLYSRNDEKGDLFHNLYSSLEEEKKTALSSSGTQAYLNHQVDGMLAQLMLYELDETGKTQFEFHSFHSYGLDGSLGGLYPNANAAEPNGTLTLFASSGQDVTVTFALNPLFADALAVELPGDKWTPAKDVPTFTRPDGGQKDQTKWSGAPGSGEARPYGVRSIDQLQLIDWNWRTRNVDTRVTNTTDANSPEHIQYFPYLSSGGNTGKYVWKQTYDILSEKVDGKHKLYSPIAEYYDPSGEDAGTLRGWFGGSYDGGGYKIENVCIQTTNSSCAGLFGVVYNGKLSNIVLYSSDGEGKITVNINQNSGYQSKWFAMGTLAGVIGANDSQQYQIKNCSAAGYRIEATTYTHSGGWGGSNIGGLVGEAHTDLSGCSAVTTVSIHDAQENDQMRVGGLVGACLGSITDCYAGGSIEIDSATVKFLNAHRGVYVGGIVGGSYMKPLDVTTSSGVIGTIGYKKTHESLKNTSNALTNCYSYVRLPKYEEPRVADKNYFAIKGLFALGGAGELDPFDVSFSEASGKSTVKNCYYLTSETLANNTAEGIHNAKYPRCMKSDAGQVTTDKTKVKLKTDLPFEPGKIYDFFDFTDPNNDWQRDGEDGFPLKNVGSYSWPNGTSKQITATANNGGTATYYLKGYGDEKTMGALIFTLENKNLSTYCFRGWLVSNQGNSLTVTTDTADSDIAAVAATVSGVTGLTYEQLADKQAGIPGKDPALKIYQLLNAGKDSEKDAFFDYVTTTEGDMSVPGKYSYPTKAHPELRDRDYPFPTILTKDNGKYHVHYGDWPLKGFRRQSLFDEKGEYQILGGSPIEIDLFVNGDAPHQEYLVLTDRIGTGGEWTLEWDSVKQAGAGKVELIAEAVEPELKDSNTIENIPNAEKGKTYYLFKLTPKKDGTDILYITYTAGGVDYTLPVTVHITAAAELRPNRLFMFPNDTLDIDVRATDKAGQTLTAGGELTLKGNPHCGSSGYLAAETLRDKAEGDKLPGIRFSTSVPEEALTDNLTLGANADFAYTITTPNPIDPDKPTVQDHGGGAGGDIRIEIIRPWKDKALAQFDEVSHDGTTQVVCTISFPDFYEVGKGETLRFAQSGALSVAPMPTHRPTAEWITVDGRIAIKLTYPEGTTLAAGIPETTVSVPLKLTSGEADGQLIEGEQLHTLTLTVEHPAETQADTQGTQSIDALPPGEDGQDSSVRRRRWKRKHQRRRPLERKS